MSVRKKALLTLGKSFFEAYPRLRDDLEALDLDLCALVLSDEPVSKDVIIRNVADVEIFIMGVEKVDKDVLDAARRLKYIAKHGVGLDNIDLEEAKRRGITITYTPGQNASAVADLAMGLVLACARQIPAAAAKVKSGGWQLFMGHELEGKTLGIVGLGAIGKKVALRALGFGMTVMAYDPVQDAEFAEKHSITYHDLNSVLEKADFVSMHLPLGPSTYHLIDAEKLRRMKPSAYLINTARGPIVNERDLVRALRDRTISGAALDVFDTEPPSRDLLELDNVIMTPHIGGSTYECARRLGEITVRNVRNYLHGRELDFVYFKP
ncbi:MAG: phosphoglycerate dehydrogenase [Firmicutes bacterium]|jgi:D-3-phosphoglycerate dehydrogenase|nr:phosphoglycerate dehydrogenase [Bacillota bacterium]MDH7495367.1 phosphoglycerate dehydrogenase [Bacillota bacterium]